MATVISKNTIPAAGHTNQNVNAITAAENTCRLGQECPFVSFGITDGSSNISYGRFRLIQARTTVTIINPSSGTQMALYSRISFCHSSHRSRHGYATKITTVNILFALCNARRTFRVIPKRLGHFNVSFFFHR